MIEFQHVWFEREGRTILADLDFEVARGEFVYVLGQTGSGKSTLLRLLLFDPRPTQGVVFVGEYDSAMIQDRQIPYLRRRIGFVFQDFKLLRDRTVFENVAFALSVTGTKGSEVKNRTLKLLSRVDLMHKRDEKPTSLSGGEQQRVAIARALINEPYVLLADEPTANLDLESTERVMEILNDVNAKGTSILMATHDIGLVERHPLRTLTLDHGALVI
ncbi:MAG: ATP-binding cassette domain-containing protein [Planctomycetes bacterium]|nr:cell division ATP-binding protein FtsE [Gemmatimonadota bacterium]MCH2375602.1 ATP-binding cassette domain-containing protein [Planctomycetota bacterium]HCK10482.1 cell division ATP-binding protein FtsE [Candidatus Latescibacterota bacterium]